MNIQSPHIFVAIPILDELDFISGVMMDLAKQDISDFTLFCCVNQPDAWWNIEEKVSVCHNNVDMLKWIENFCTLNNIRLVLQDKCSPGKGWNGRQGGVGWARKTLMDAISDIADAQDIIVSLDADTRVEKNYLKEIERQFALFPMASAIALPYYHRLQGDDNHKKSMLRYEIYLRSYALNLLRIDHPFAYTPIGSAMAARVSAYRKIRGLQATVSGEDFYFMMKLRKTGVILTWCDTRVYPSSRKSNRVIFGTGPTVALGASGQVERYPVYHPSLFDEIADACQAFGEIFITGSDRAVQRALGVFPELEYEKLLKNNPQIIRFIHACYMKADAFGIYKYVRSHQRAGISDVKSITRLLEILKWSSHCQSFDGVDPGKHWSLDDKSEPDPNIELHDLSVDVLKSLRTLLMKTEENILKEKYNRYFALRNEYKNPIWKYMN